MLRNLLLVTFMAMPVGGLAYHYGPGQDQMLLDDVAVMAARGDQSARDENWGDAVASYDAALKDLPAGHLPVQQRLKLARAKAAMLDSKLPAAANDLANLVEELQNTGADQHPELLRESREALANAQFYMTWLLRLEGKQREEWEPQIEASRQTFRLLAEDAIERGDAKQQQRSSEDLEAAVKLARLDIEDLQGLPLPSE